MTAVTERRFLVARQGREVVIREVRPGSNAFEFDRRTAYSHATTLAMKCKAHPEQQIVFLGLDGMSRVLGTPTQLFQQRRAPSAAMAPTNDGQPVEEATEAMEEMVALWRDGRTGDVLRVPRDSELALVVLDLREGNLQGRLNDWGASVLEQFERNGRLSEKQIAAGMKGVRAKQAHRPGQGPLPEVPTGRYAVDSAEGELRFYRVSVSRGGRTFIAVQHGPDESDVPFSWEGYRAILQSVVDAGPAAAAIRYGREIGRCSRCGMRLTNRLSRELGIGPICGGHWHEKDEWTEKKRTAREAIRTRGEDPEEEVA